MEGSGPVEFGKVSDKVLGVLSRFAEWFLGKMSVKPKQRTRGTVTKSMIFGIFTWVKIPPVL